MEKRVHLEHLTDNTHSEWNRVLLIRDPRDLLISQIFHMEKWNWPGCPLLDRDQFNKATFSQRLDWLISFPNELFCTDRFFGIKEYVQMSLELMKDPSVLTCRFEDLVGPRGNGDRSIQIDTVMRLASHFGYPLSHNEAVCIADQLYGDTATFREGQIGSWERTFSQDQKDTFKRSMGSELIELGYVNDNNW